MVVLRALALVLVAALAAGTIAGRAESALFFVFSPTAAKPGEDVAVLTPQTPWSFDLRRDGARPLQHPIPLYLVPNAIADDVTSPDDPRLRAIGSIILDRTGRGVLRFVVPTLPSDRYAVAGICVQCAPYSRGSTFFVLPVGPRTIAREWRPVMLLRVEGTSALEPKSKRRDALLPWALAALGALGIGHFAWRARRRDSRSSWNRRRRRELERPLGPGLQRRLGHNGVEIQRTVQVGENHGSPCFRWLVPKLGRHEVRVDPKKD
jgi:hypothetical protein